MTNDIALDQLRTGQLSTDRYDLFLKGYPDEPVHRSVEFVKHGFANGAPSADFRDPETKEPIRDVAVSQYVARFAATTG